MDTLPQTTIEHLNALMQACKEVLPDCRFALYDTENATMQTENPQCVIDEMQGGDEEYGLEVYDSTSQYQCTFYLLPYEEEDMIFDYNSNQIADQIFNLYLTKTERN